MSNATAPHQPTNTLPTLTDLLTAINRQLNVITQELAQVKQTTLELQTTLAKRRFVRTPGAPPTTEALMPSIVATLERFWDANRMPMPLHYLSRLYTRQLAGSKVKFIDLLTPANNREIKIIATATGSVSIVLGRIWDAAPAEKRMYWQGASMKELIEERQAMRESLADGVDGEMRSDGTISLRDHASDLTERLSGATSAHEGTSA